MFTGLVSGVGEIADLHPIGDGRDARFTICAPDGFLDGARIGASIACAGCCLTATSLQDNAFTVEASSETLRLTTLAGWQPGSPINLERSLRLGDELGGHLVSGHVDGLGHLVSATPEQGSLRLAFRLPASLARFVAVKGSIAVDGVSLTVNAVSAEGFAVNIIPHTAGATTLGALRAGDAVNIEIDTLARYVARLAETGPSGAAASATAGPAASGSA